MDGEVRLMTGGAAAHNAVAVNLIVALKTRLRGGPCTPYGSDMKVRIPIGNVRYPDITVDCGRPKPTDLWAAEPTVIAEVLSPPTEWFDQTQKLEEYQSIPTVAHVAFLSQSRAFARVWSHAERGWTSIDAQGPEAKLAFAAINCEIPLAEAYEGVEFPVANDGV